MFSLVPASAGGPSPPPPPLFFLSRKDEQPKAGTCAHDRRALQQHALNVHVKHSDLTWPDLLDFTVAQRNLYMIIVPDIQHGGQFENVGAYKYWS